MDRKPSSPLPTQPVRPLARHVQAAVSATSQGKMANLPAAKTRTPAAHVQRAIGLAQAKPEPHTPQRSPAPHVQNAMTFVQPKCLPRLTNTYSPGVPSLVVRTGTVQRAPEAQTSAATLPDVIRILNDSLSGKWAFTGSFAISLHSRMANIGFRQPDDIDILIDGGADLAEWPIRDGLSGEKFKISRESGVIHLQLLSGLKIDLISGGKKFGKASSSATLQVPVLGKVPVMDLATLKETKLKALEEAQDELRGLNEDDAPGIRDKYNQLIGKNKGDLQHLERL